MTNQHRRSTDGWSVRPIRVAFVILTLVFLIVLLIFAKVVHDVSHNSGNIKKLVGENTNRIQDIQKSRLESCKRTYGGIEEVFKPFFPPPPRTKKQQHDLDKFKATVDRLQTACINQVTPPKIKGGNT